MRRSKKVYLKAAAAALVLMFFLSGCMYIQPNVEELMQPPKLSKEQSEVYAALEEAAGKNIRLQYPKKGKYRSPFVFYDLDGDSEEEAIALYSQSTNTSNIRINILSKTANGWSSVYDIVGYSNEVDSIDFVKMDFEEEINLVIGWSVYGSEDCYFILYEYANRKLRDIYSDSYSELLACDTDQDGSDEIVVVQKGNSYRDAAVRVIKKRRGEVVLHTELALISDLESYRQVQFGPIAKEQMGLFIDGVRADGRLSTQVVAFGEREIQLFYPPRISAEVIPVNETLRSEELLSTDIDGDGVLEVPVQASFSEYESPYPGDQPMLTQWCTVSAGTLTPKLSAVMNVGSGYYYILPEEWEGRITVYNDSDLNEYVFHQNSEGNLSKTRTFLKIRVCQRGDDRNRIGLDSYRLVRSKGVYDYFVYTAENTGAEGDFYVSPTELEQHLVIKDLFV